MKNGSVSDLGFEIPFDLFIGRKRQRITEPAVFEMKPNIVSSSEGWAWRSMVISETYRLFIGGRLFASVTAFPKRRYGRAPIKIVKPICGPTQIHFVKKYVTIHEEGGAN